MHICRQPEAGTGSKRPNDAPVSSLDPWNGQMVPGTGRIRATAHDVKKTFVCFFANSLPHFNLSLLTCFHFAHFFILKHRFCNLKNKRVKCVFLEHRQRPRYPPRHPIYALHATRAKKTGHDSNVNRLSVKSTLAYQQTAAANQHQIDRRCEQLQPAA